jgi:hypothetical protein
VRRLYKVIELCGRYMHTHIDTSQSPSATQSPSAFQSPSASKIPFAFQCLIFPGQYDTSPSTHQDNTPQPRPLLAPAAAAALRVVLLRMGPDSGSSAGVSERLEAGVARLRLAGGFAPLVVSAVI